MSQECHYCRGKLKPKPVTRAQEYEGRWYGIENLPALVCEQCGETYFTPAAHDRVVALITSGEPPVRVENIQIYDAALAG